MANIMTQQQLQQMCQEAAKLGFRPERLLLLDQRLTEWSQGGITPSIVVRVLRHGQLAYEAAYGVQGPGKEPNSLITDAIFPVCSITKPVVSTLLHIMQEEGLLDLNRSVKEYLPEFTGDEKGLVKIWHLLCHSSGIIEEDLDKNFDTYLKDQLGIVPPDDDAPAEEWDHVYLKIREKLELPFIAPSSTMRHDTYMNVVLKIPPTYPPQTVMKYCSAGYQMAMDIIKKFCGMPIEEYARSKLFDPLGMKDSCFFFPREKMDRYVTRGDDFCGGRWLNEYVLDSDSGGGGLKSTAQDITNLAQMYLNKGTYNGKRILSAASIREITSDHNSRLAQAEYEGEKFDSTWGLGWSVRGIKKDDSGMLRSARTFDHGGFGCTRILCDPDADLVAAYFTVCKTDCYWKLSNFIDMIIGAIDE